MCLSEGPLLLALSFAWKSPGRSWGKQTIDQDAWVRNQWGPKPKAESPGQQLLPPLLSLCTRLSCCRSETAHCAESKRFIHSFVVAMLERAQQHHHFYFIPLLFHWARRLYRIMSQTIIIHQNYGLKNRGWENCLPGCQVGPETPGEVVWEREREMGEREEWLREGGCVHVY